MDSKNRFTKFIIISCYITAFILVDIPQSQLASLRSRIRREAAKITFIEHLNCHTNETHHVPRNLIDCVPLSLNGGASAVKVESVGTGSEGHNNCVISVFKDDRCRGRRINIALTIGETNLPTDGVVGKATHFTLNCN